MKGSIEQISLYDIFTMNKQKILEQEKELRVLYNHNLISMNVYNEMIELRFKLRKLYVIISICKMTVAH